MVPQDILDAYHNSLGDSFNGLPKMPKEIAEVRVVSLQEELSTVDPEDTARVANLNREITETQEILDTQNYSETAEDIAYWETYKQGLRNYILSLQQ